MVIDQRNAGASISNNNTGTQYSLDRWLIYGSASSKFTVQKNAGAITPPVGFSNYLGVTSSAATAVGSSDLYEILQRIEGFNCADLMWGTANAQTITISFWVRSSLTGTFGGSLANNAANRSYLFSYTISSANTWELKTLTIAGDTTGTWETNNAIGIDIRFGLGSGSTYSGAAGSWLVGNLIQPTGSVSVVGTSGATFYITGVQLERGSQSTNFEYRDYGRELMMCQRYYEVGGFFLVGFGSAGSALGSTIKYAVVKRTSPTLTQTNTSTAGTISTTPQNASTGVPTESVLSYRGLTSGAAQYSEIWTASAEL
jgi:hypothetical protein